MRSKFWCSFILVLAVVSTASAQWNYVNVAAIHNMTAMIQNAYSIQALNRAIDGRTSSSSSSGSNRPASSVARPAAPLTNFRPGSQRLMVRGFAQSLSSKPEGVPDIVQAMNEGFKAFEGEAKRLGKPNNVAMAFAYLVGVCYYVHYGVEPAERALLTLQEKSDAAFGASATFKRLNNTDRQKLYEAFVLMATLPLAGYTVAVSENDAALKKTYRDVAATALEIVLGVRPERLRFTATALELR
jgi:hypothetical protein